MKGYSAVTGGELQSEEGLQGDREKHKRMAGGGSGAARRLH